MKYGAVLHVYFFERSCGKGKVASFETAGAENLRREALLDNKKAARQSQSFVSRRLFIL